MIIKIEIPNALPEGHGASFKKGVAEVLLKNSPTPLGHTPNGHERSRKLGTKLGKVLAKEVAKAVKPVESKE